MKENIRWISIIEESPGVLSTARIILFIVFFFTVALPISTVIWQSWGKPEFMKLDPVLVDYCKYIFGIAFLGKVAQSIFGEKSPTEVVPAVPAVPTT
jgi:hypothetical protein